MNAAEFFRDVVKANFEQFNSHPGDLRVLWNAIVSMNTVAEYVALDQLGYQQVSRAALAEAANQIRDRFRSLSDLKYCAEAFKHVRKIKDDRKRGSFTTIATSTGVSSGDQTTWQIDSYDLVDVLRKAFETLTAFPELK